MSKRYVVLDQDEPVAIIVPYPDVASQEIESVLEAFVEAGYHMEAE